MDDTDENGFWPQKDAKSARAQRVGALVTASPDISARALLAVWRKMVERSKLRLSHCSTRALLWSVPGNRCEATPRRPLPRRSSK